MTRSALRARMERLAAQMRPDLRRQFLRAFDRLAASLPPDLLARWITEGAAVEERIAERVAEHFAGFRQQVRIGLERSALAFRKDVPGGTVGIAFDVLSPTTLDALRDLDTRVMQGIVADLRETVRAHIAHGLQEGWNPRRTARSLREILPLAPNQERAIVNFERMLRERDAALFTRRLRDRRFDATIRRAFAGEGLTDAQIGRMVTAYRRRMVAFNAETHARTATLDAMRQGQRLAWEQAIARGVIGRDQLWKERVTVGDSRVREEHAAINGEIRRLDEPYSNGEVVSGDLSYNCRCVDRVFARAA